MHGFYLYMLFVLIKMIRFVFVVLIIVSFAVIVCVFSMRGHIYRICRIKEVLGCTQLVNEISHAH